MIKQWKHPFLIYFYLTDLLNLSLRDVSLCCLLKCVDRPISLRYFSDDDKKCYWVEQHPLNKFAANGTNTNFFPGKITQFVPIHTSSPILMLSSFFYNFIKPLFQIYL